MLGMDSAVAVRGLLAVVGALSAALHAVPARAADHADAPILTGVKIPDTSDTLAEIGLSWTDDAYTLFDGADDNGGVGFGVLKFRDPTSFKFHKIAPDPKGEASVSGSSFAYLVDEGGVPAIYGVEDVDQWNPVLLLRAGSDLGGGFTVSEIGPFALGGKKLVVVAKKQGGEAIFGLPDFAGGDPVLLAETGAPTPDLGDITGFKGVSTDGVKVAFHALAAEGEGVYLTEDWSGVKFNPVASTNAEIPGSPGAFRKFQVFGRVKWNGKKVTFQGGDGDTLEGIYFKDDFGDPDGLQVLADTASSWSSDPELLFTDIEDFSVRKTRTVFVASANDGSRAGYLDEVGKAKRVLADGDLLKSGHKLMSFKATQQSLGSFVVTGVLDSGEQALVIADTSIQLPALPSLGLRLLLVVALVAVVLSLRGLRRPTRSTA